MRARVIVWVRVRVRNRVWVGLRADEPERCREANERQGSGGAVGACCKCSKT